MLMPLQSSSDANCSIATCVQFPLPLLANFVLLLSFDSSSTAVDDGRWSLTSYRLATSSMKNDGACCDEANTNLPPSPSTLQPIPLAEEESFSLPVAAVTIVTFLTNLSPSPAFLPSPPMWSASSIDCSPCHRGSRLEHSHRPLSVSVE